MALRSYQGADLSRLATSETQNAFSHVHQTVFKCIQVNTKRKTHTKWMKSRLQNEPSLACFKAEPSAFKLTLVYRFARARCRFDSPPMPDWV